MKRFVVFFFFAVLLAFNTYAQNADINILRNINPDNPGASFFWKTTTNSVYPLTFGIQGGLMAYDYFHSDSSRKKILSHIAEKLVVFVITDGIKLIVNRQRPYVTYPGLIHPYQSSETGLSFPSGHTSLAFNTAATVSIRFHKWYITVPAYIWASFVGYSRLYLGEHYPSDVIAGAIIGTGSAYLVQWIDKKIFPGKNKEPHALP